MLLLRWTYLVQLDSQAGSKLDRSVPAVVPRQLDFQFPNIVLTPTNFQFRAPLIYRQSPVPTPVDFQGRNLVVFTQPIQPFSDLFYHTPAVLNRPFDIQFRNLALLNAAQLQVHPVGAALDETVPQPPPHQLDFAFPNVAGIQTAQLQVHPVGTALDESVPKPPVRQLDFQFPNVANPPTVVGTPLVSILTRDQPAPQARQLDFQFPNIALSPTNFEFRPPLFYRPVATALPTDAPLPNLLTTTLSIVQVKPIVPPEFTDTPAPQQRVQEFVPPNIPALNAAQLQVKPVGSATNDQRPIVVPRSTDTQLPNLLTSTLFVSGTPIVAPFFIFSDKPAPAAQRWDQAQPNLTINLPPPVAATLIQRTLVGVGL